jgi:hypothetical protein
MATMDILLILDGCLRFISASLIFPKLCKSFIDAHASREDTLEVAKNFDFPVRRNKSQRLSPIANLKWIDVLRRDELDHEVLADDMAGASLGCMYEAMRRGDTGGCSKRAENNMRICELGACGADEFKQRMVMGEGVAIDCDVWVAESPHQFDRGQQLEPDAVNEQWRHVRVGIHISGENPERE